MKKSLFMLILFTLTLSSALFAGGQGDASDNKDKAKTLQLKMGTKMSEESIEGQGHRRFAELVAQRSNGSMEIIIYPSEQLGNASTEVNNVLNGAQDIYAEGLAFYASYVPAVKIENIPYLFTDEEQFKNIMAGDFGKMVENQLEEKGFKLINTDRSFARGPYRVMCSTRPVKSLQDLQGLRMRMSGNPISMNAYAALGANPIQIAWTETYLALKQGTVEAVTSPISLVYNMKFTEVAPYVAVVNEFPQYVAYVMNAEKFNSLSPEQKKILVDCANEAGEYATELTKTSINDQIALMKKEHKAVFTDVDTAPFKEKLIPYYMKLDNEGTFGKGAIKSILEE